MPTITSEQLEHFEHFGFVTVENLIDPESVIDPVIDEYAGVLDSLADELYEDGTISSKYEELEFGDRVTQIYAESGEVYNGYFDFSLPQGGIKEDTPFWAGPAVFDALTAPELLDAVESFHRAGDLLQSRSARPDQGAGEPGATRRQRNGEVRRDALASRRRSSQLRTPMNR